MSKAKKNPFPPHIFIALEEQGTSDQWINAHTTVAGLLDAPPDEREVGHYEFVKTIHVKSDVRIVVGGEDND